MKTNAYFDKNNGEVWCDYHRSREKCDMYVDAHPYHCRHTTKAYVPNYDIPKLFNVAPCLCEEVIKDATALSKIEDI